MEAGNDVARLVEVSTRKYKLLEQMLQTYLEQNEALSSEEGALEQEMFLEKRQQLMDAVDKLDEQFHVYAERLKTTLGITSLEELAGFQIPGREELKTLVGRITTLLEELSDRHHKTSLRMQDMQQATSLQIKQLQKSRQVNQAYQPGNPAAPTSVYFDKKK